MYGIYLPTFGINLWLIQAFFSIHGAHGIYLSHVFHHFSSFLTTRHPTWRIIPLRYVVNHRGDRFRPKDLGLLNTRNIYGLFVGLKKWGWNPSHLEVLPMILQVQSFENEPKPWLFIIVYLGLYYPVIWGLFLNHHIFADAPSVCKSPTDRRREATD